VTTYTTDPFTQVLDKIWAVLEADPRFTSKVRLKNRIKGPDVKDALAESDIEEVEIVPAGSEVNLRDSENRNRVTQRFQLKCTNGGGLPTSKHFPLKWVVVTALSRAGADLGLSFVYNVSVTEGNETYAAPEDTRRGQTSWKGTIGIVVEMNFHKLDN